MTVGHVTPYKSPWLSMLFHQDGAVRTKRLYMRERASHTESCISCKSDKINARSFKLIDARLDICQDTVMMSFCLMGLDMWIAAQTVLELASLRRFSMQAALSAVLISSSNALSLLDAERIERFACLAQAYAGWNCVT
jgi:hypothetical protein